jgi:hypothetical protein
MTCHFMPEFMPLYAEQMPLYAGANIKKAASRG